MTDALSYLSNAVKSLFNDAATADFQVHCEGVVFYVHTLILNTRSQYFKALINSGFQEAQENMVTIDDINSEVMRSLLLGIYSGGYDSNRMGSPHQRVLHEAQVLQLTRRFLVTGLDEACVQNLENLGSQLLFKDVNLKISLLAILRISETLVDHDLKLRVAKCFTDLAPSFMELCSFRELRRCPELLWMALYQRAPSSKQTLHLKCPNAECGSESWFTLRIEDGKWRWKNTNELKCPGCNHKWKLGSELRKANKKRAA